jgi:hypothetical protein
VIRLAPGCEVPAQYHNACWDYFVPLSGREVIESSHCPSSATTTTTTTTAAERKAGEEGEVVVFEMDKDSFLAMPPGDVHRVRNAVTTTTTKKGKGKEEEGEDFIFLIAQSPRKEYDFMEVK